MKLNGPQSEALSKVLREAFSPPALNRMLYYKLNRRLSDYSGYDNGGNAQQGVFELLAAANSEEWVHELLLAAREALPRNSELFAFSQQFGLTSTRASHQQLERFIVESNQMLDVELFRSNLGALEPRVCRIEYSADGLTRFGTGFLVAPDVILTNHHVVAALITAKSSAAVARFDFRNVYDAGGNLVRTNQGRTCAFANPWLIDSSTNTPDGQVPKADELDYALIRLNEPAADDIVDGGADLAAPPKRGFIEIPAAPHDYPKGAGLFILQHPSAQPLKLALDTNSVLGLFDQGTRVRYTTNTEPGSSGSPCFTPAWQLTALHHSGDPNFDPAHKPTYNEGIPIFAVRHSIEQRGHGAVLGAAKD